MKTVQIPYDLFLNLAMYHLRGEVEFRRAIAGLFLRGSCDRSVTRSCGWQARRHIACYPLASPVPIEKSAEFEMDVGRRLCAADTCK